MIRTPNGLAALFGRLTDPTDRETYASLISFVDSLPPGDELSRLVELLGLLSLLGQRLPDALGELLSELRSQTKAAADYHGQLDTRLAALPREIAGGVDAAGVAKAMSEAFRQQLNSTGLQDTAALLEAATGALRTMACNLSTTLKPVAADFRGVATTLSREIEKLLTAARKVEEHNERLMAQHRSNRRGLLALGALTVFLIGGLCGILVEKQQTTDLLSGLSAQIAQAHSPA